MRISDWSSDVCSSDLFTLFGAQYAMRIWIDPAKLNNYALTAGDVSAAIEAQNVQISSGQLGALPAKKGQQLNATIVGPTRLQTPEEFRSEEHTSELQSLMRISYAVFCLKKKKRHKQTHNNHDNT